MPGLGRRALVGELTIDHVARGELVNRVHRRVLRDRDRPTRPIHHAPENRGHVLNDLVGLLPCLEVQVAGKARLEPAQSVGNELIAILSHSIQGPLINLCLRDIAAQPITGARDQVIETPGRVIRPGDLEGAVPDPAVGPSGRVVVRRHPHAQQLHVVAAAWDGGELRGIDPQRHQGAVGIPQLALDDLGVGLQIGLVLDCR